MRTTALIATLSALSATIVLSSSCSESRVTHASVTDQHQPRTPAPGVLSQGPESPKASTESSKASTYTKPNGNIDSDTKPITNADLSSKNMPELPGDSPDNDTLDYPRGDKPAQPSSDSPSATGTHASKPVEPLPSATQSDADNKLAARIRTAITSDERLMEVAGTITVVVRGGMVTLQGRVNDPSQKEAAETVTKSVSGVEQVDNQLVVQRD